MRTTLSLGISRSIQWGVCPIPPGCRPPMDADPPGCRPPLKYPLEVNPHGCRLPLPVDRMTDACENITVPQTLFAGGYYLLCLTSLQFPIFWVKTNVKPIGFTEPVDFKFCASINLDVCLVYMHLQPNELDELFLSMWKKEDSLIVCNITTVRIYSSLTGIFSWSFTFWNIHVIFVEVITVLNYIF